MLKDMLIIMFCAFLATGTLIYGLACVVNRIEFYGDVAEIEQLRQDVATVDLYASEDIYGQVAMVNQRIKKMQRYNELWWADPLFPDGWNDVQLIEVGNV